MNQVKGTLQYYYKVTRIEQCFIVLLGTWAVVLLSNGPLWFNEPKLAVAVSMFFSCLGASLYHYGARYDIYELKWYDQVIVKSPELLKFLGTMSFMVSIIIAHVYLPSACIYIAGFNYLAIILYAKFLDQYWPWKNLTIALVCVSPVIAGWFSGHRLHPLVPYLIAAIFFAYLARENIKDVQDREANHGMRYTMVMHVGIDRALKIAGGFLLMSVGILIVACYQLPLPTNDFFSASANNFLPVVIIDFYAVGVIFLLHYGWQLSKGARFENYYRYIDVAISCLILSILGIRIAL